MYVKIAVGRCPLNAEPRSTKPLQTARKRIREQLKPHPTGPKNIRHYETRKTVIAERFKFYKMQQKEGESIANDLAQLRRLEKECEFAVSLNRALSDQLVCSLRREGFRQKVLGEQDLKLENALSPTQAYETE